MEKTLSLGSDVHESVTCPSVLGFSGAFIVNAATKGTRATMVLSLKNIAKGMMLLVREY